MTSLLIAEAESAVHRLTIALAQARAAATDDARMLALQRARLHQLLASQLVEAALQVAKGAERAEAP